MNKKRILVAAIHYPIASGRYIARALRRMGHDVRTAGPAMGREVWGLTLEEGSEWVPDFPDGEDEYGYHQTIPQGWIPELVINADSGYTRELHSINQLVWGGDYIPHVVYGVDNHVRDYQHGIDYDYLFLAHGNGMRIGEDNVIHLPCAYDPEWHVMTTPLAQRQWPATMVGMVYEDRAAIVEALGTKYRVLAGTGAIMERYRDLYNDALVSICRSIDGDMAQRIFETAAMGNIIISDYCHDFEALGFEEGVHFLGADEPKDYLAAMHEIMTWPDEKVQAMSDAAREWVKPHTWDARCQVILDTVFGKGA